MVRREPASFFARKSRSNRVTEDCPDRFRPPPCMPDDPAVWSAGGVMLRHHPVRLASAAAIFVCADRPVRFGTPALDWRRGARKRPASAGLCWPRL